MQPFPRISVAFLLFPTSTYIWKSSRNLQLTAKWRHAITKKRRMQKSVTSLRKACIGVLTFDQLLYFCTFSLLLLFALFPRRWPWAGSRPLFPRGAFLHRRPASGPRALTFLFAAWWPATGSGSSTSVGRTPTAGSWSPWTWRGRRPWLVMLKRLFTGPKKKKKNPWESE